MSTTGIGARVARKEDHRFITGRGRYTDDITLPHQSYAYLLRSPHAHAIIKRIETRKARTAPGVLAVFTGEDLKTDGIGGLPCGFVPAPGPQNSPPRPALAVGKVRFVGDPLAMVVAETPAAAKSAAEQIDVQYKVIEACVDPAKALDTGQPQLHDEAPNNLCIDWQLGDKDATDRAFAAAHHVTRLQFLNNRKIPNAIEPRAANAAYDPGTQSFTLYTTSQNPHITRLLIAAFEFGIPEHKLRVVAPDIGGGFGSKIPHYPEETLVTWATRKVGRPVKWTAERSESFMADAHGRDHVTEAELALDRDGKILGLRVKTIANLGAYLSTFGALSSTYLYATLLSGQYVIPAIHCSVKGVFTNTAPIDAERGAGRPEATYVVERLMETAGRETGIGIIELRRRNFINPDAFPYQTPVALLYDSGNYAPVLDQALKLADYDGFAERRAASQRNGKLRGLGLSTYIEACGLAPSNVAGAIGAGVGLYETAEVRFSPTGSVVVYSGAKAQGQGHETTFAQLVSEKLGIPIDKIELIQGDTEAVQWGHGTYGSRSLAVGGSAIVKACDKVIEKATKVAAHLLEASPADIKFESGTFTVKGTDKQKTIGEVIMAAYVPHNFPLQEMEPGLDARTFYDPANFTFPFGCHVCEVEIDPDTGETRIVNWVAVDDFGTIINPMIVEGQVHGGIAHGVGQALLERCVYDPDSGQLVTGSYMDYCMPRASDLPGFKLDFKVTPSPHNPLGAKGCGEAGAIAAPAAVINAITDAIGINDIPMPATPQTVWQAIESAGVKQAAE